MAEGKKGLDFVSIRLKKERTLREDVTIDSPDAAIDFIRDELGDYDRELFIVLNINNAGIPVNASITSIGDQSGTVVHPREVFKTAMLSSASAVILMHNHPSGVCSPSKEDISVTERLCVCGQLLGIRVTDHIIFSHDRYFSFQEHGVLKDSLFNLDSAKKVVKKELEDEPEI